jgi:hypothetical protein
LFPLKTCRHKYFSPLLSSQRKFGSFARAPVLEYKIFCFGGAEVPIGIEQFDAVNTAIPSDIHVQLIRNRNGCHSASLGTKANVGNIKVRIVRQIHAAASKVFDDDRNNQPSAVYSNRKRIDLPLGVEYPIPFSVEIQNVAESRSSEFRRRYAAFQHSLFDLRGGCAAFPHSHQRHAGV